MECSRGALKEIPLPNEINGVSSRRRSQGEGMMTIDRYFTPVTPSDVMSSVVDDSASVATVPQAAVVPIREVERTMQLEIVPAIETSHELISESAEERSITILETEYARDDNSVTEVTYQKTLPTFLTPPKTPMSSQQPSETTLPKRKVVANEPSTSRKTKVKRLGTSRQKPVSLKSKLKGLNSEQFIELIESLTESHPELQDEIECIIPKPDLTSHQETLEKLNRCIHKSLPYSRYGSSRDAFCYRRVATHLQNFKRACLSQGRELVECQAWESVINYTFIAWDINNETPLWDNDAHNKVREQCFKGVASLCMKALKKSSLEKDAYLEIKERLQEATEVNTEIQPCLAEVEKILKKL